MVYTKENLPPQKVFLPKLLFLRLTRREKAGMVGLFYMVFNFSFIVIGALFLDATWNTRSYIINGDEFWDYYSVYNLQDKEIPNNAAFSGMFTLLVGFLNFMNVLVMTLHIYFGGLKIRIQFGNFFHLFFQILLFIYAIIPVGKYKSIIILYPLLLGFAGVNMCLSLFYFLSVRRIVKRETDYMLPLNLLNHHKNEYMEEYIQKMNKNSLIANENYNNANLNQQMNINPI
jgi:hypothetical protein